jgi:cob(I)alamin adenosyltransferase
MPHITRIYTRTGDSGTTSLGGGQRVPKDSLRVRAYGAVDELNSTLGVAGATGLCPRLAELLPVVQSELFSLGSDLCFPEGDPARQHIQPVQARQVEQMERWIDEFAAVVGPLVNFVLPGGAPGAAQLHVARTVCRRAEREVMALSRAEIISPQVLSYLNRLSDLLFVMARFENHARGIAEPQWKAPE